MGEKNPQVLIVGAGPTGLMMACQLAIQNVSFRIIEKNPGQTTQSRALGVQARTLEVFQQMGIADSAVSQGQKGKALNYITTGLRRHIPFEHMGEGLSAFPYLLILEQPKTEKLMIDFLKTYDKHIEWETELLSLTQNSDGVSAVIKGKKGKEEHVETAYCVGADGAHSIVRHQLGIPLLGVTYKQMLYVLDCSVDAAFKQDEIYISFAHETFVAFFPMQNGKWRIVSILPPDIAGKKKATFEDIQKHFSEHLDFPITLSHPDWLSEYKAHHRCVRHFRVGRCFLAGDAANIHSPVGAQGMNTGLQDAYNLGWKMAFVLQHKAKPDLLDTYNEERLPFAKKLVQTTDRIFSLVVAKNIFEIVFTRYIAPTFMKFALKNGTISNFIFTTVSQIGIHYQSGILAEHASFGTFPHHSPRPGERLPYIQYTNETGETENIQDLITVTNFHLFVFSDEKDIRQKIQDAVRKYNEEIIIHVFPYSSQTLYTSFGIQKEGWFIIRPDLYIASRSQQLNLNFMHSYFDRFLKTKESKGGDKNEN